MFEVGFSEIILILGLALVVLGPERLPDLAAKVGRWTGRARAMARQFQTQLEQEVQMDAVRKANEQSATPHYPDTSALNPESSTSHSIAPPASTTESSTAPAPTAAAADSSKQ